MRMDTNQLRLISSYRVGTDLTDRLVNAIRDQATQAQALRYAADEIDRLRARVQALEKICSITTATPLQARRCNGVG